MLSGIKEEKFIRRPRTAIRKKIPSRVKIEIIKYYFISNPISKLIQNVVKVGLGHLVKKHSNVVIYLS